MTRDTLLLDNQDLEETYNKGIFDIKKKVLEITKKNKWKLKYADGSQAKDLFLAHNKVLDKIKQAITQEKT